LPVLLALIGVADAATGYFDYGGGLAGGYTAHHGAGGVGVDLTIGMDWLPQLRISGLLGPMCGLDGEPCTFGEVAELRVAWPLPLQGGARFGPTLGMTPIVPRLFSMADASVMADLGLALGVGKYGWGHWRFEARISAEALADSGGSTATTGARVYLGVVDPRGLRVSVDASRDQVLVAVGGSLCRWEGRVGTGKALGCPGPRRRRSSAAPSARRASPTPAPPASPAPPSAPTPATPAPATPAPATPTSAPPAPATPTPAPADPVPADPPPADPPPADPAPADPQPADPAPSEPHPTPRIPPGPQP
jgi:hypothetical protein